MFNKLFVIFAFSCLLLACTPEPTPTPAPTPVAICNPPSHPFGENGLTTVDWKEWDGSERVYSTQGGSTYHITEEKNIVSIILDPSNPNWPTEEVGRFQPDTNRPIALPLATEVLTETGLKWFITGPIMLFRCKNGSILLNDEYKDLNVEIEAMDIDQFEIPNEWKGQQA